MAHACLELQLRTFGDEDEGVNLARDLNKHLLNYKRYYVEKISADFPMTVKLGSGEKDKIFQNCEEFFSWLKGSDEATYMWRGCVDLVAVTNMTHMNIDLVVYEHGHKPELVFFKPDPMFPWMENDPMKPGNIIRDKMTVQNWKNLHYNLIVNPSRMFSQQGSFGFQNSEAYYEKSPKSEEVKLKEADRSEMYEIHKACKAKLCEKESEVSSLKLEVKKLRQKLNVEVREKLQLRKEIYDSKDKEE